MRCRVLYFKRRMINTICLVLASVGMLIGLLWLLLILASLVKLGFAGLSLQLVTQVTQAPGNHGGLLNAIVGSLLLVFFAILIGTPIGILIAAYLAEYGKNSKIASVVRFINDILISAPSIILGIFIYEIYVLQVGHFSGWAGVFALSLSVIPIIIRTAEDMFILVPQTLKEASFALGTPVWRTILAIILPVSKTGVLTGILLATARITGETAPLLFTALNNQFWSLNLNQPIASLPIVIYQYAMSPYEDWHQTAWSGALLITLFILSINIIIRVVFKQKPPIT
jgi:phosphate transport system permease protein